MNGEIQKEWTPKECWEMMVRVATREFLKGVDNYRSKGTLYIYAELTALRAEVEMLKGNIMLAIGVQHNDEQAFIAERKAIAEEVRGMITYIDRHAFADRIEKGEVKP